MNTSGRKNAAGGRLRGEFFRRIGLAGILCMAVTGFGLGFLLRGLPLFDAAAGSRAQWAITGVVLLAFGIFYAYCRRVDATWGRGLEAERHVGDLIELAVARRGCAFAHDVKEALGGRGNVDHVVMTPRAIWVVETKSGWLSKRRFHQALRQVAENTKRVRHHLETSLPVRGTLVIADRSDDSFEADYDWKGEPIKAFRAKMFLKVLRIECEQAPADARPSETARLVWNLGSTRHLGP